MKIKTIPIGDLKPHPGNPRKNHDVDRISASIREFGWRSPIVVWEGDGMIVAGHGRLLAAKQLGQTKAPVHFVGADEMTAAQASAYRLMDNKSAEGSEWDEALLLAQIDDLIAQGEDPALAGFSEAMRDEIEWRLKMEDLPEQDPSIEWDGMPEFVQDDKEAFQSVRVHFPDRAAVDRFAELVGQKLTERTRAIWFPQAEIERYADKRYAASEEA